MRTNFFELSKVLKIMPGHYVKIEWYYCWKQLLVLCCAVFIHMLRINRCHIYYVTYVTWFILRSVFILPELNYFQEWFFWRMICMDYKWGHHNWTQLPVRYILDTFRQFELSYQVHVLNKFINGRVLGSNW